MNRLIAPGLTVLLLAGCSEAFNPETSGPRPLVVFAVLQSATDTQTVRVHPSMAPSVLDPVPLEVPGANVAITSPGELVTFTPVLLPGEPGTAASTIPAFQAMPFIPTRGRTYTITVTTPGGVATGSTTVPSYIPDAVGVRNVSVLEGPTRYEPEVGIVVAAVLSEETLGFAIRLVLEYEVLRGSLWVRERREVPRSFISVAPESADIPVYPALVRRADVRSTLRQSDLGIFRNEMYLRILRSITQDYGAVNVRMSRAIVLLHQADLHFFTYFAYANSFQDRLSIRLDQPDYSNLSGALGVFGSLATDSLSVPLPSDVHTR